jgi:hypothetical protein
MEDMFTLKELLAQAYEEVMSMKAEEIENRFATELADKKFHVGNLVSYSKALSVKRSAIAGDLYCVLN